MKCGFIVALVFFTVVLAFASDQEDVAADAVATAFLQARETAHLSKLERMGRNTFRKQVCKQNLRLPSGLINDVTYKTSDPSSLPELAQKLATTPDSYRVTARFGMGVCILKAGPSERPEYSIFIATYESRWTSFWRILWE